MHIYRNHLLDTMNDSRVIYELLKTTSNEDMILVFNVDSDKDKLQVLEKNIRYHNMGREILITDDFNVLKNHSQSTGLLFVCGKEDTLLDLRNKEHFKKLTRVKTLGLCC